MLPKSKRVTTPLFKEIISKGSPFYGETLLLRCIKNSNSDLKNVPESRFSVAVSKKVAKTAVERNKIRRRVNVALRNVYDEVKNGCVGVFFVKDRIKIKKIPEIVEELHMLLSKSGCLK